MPLTQVQAGMMDSTAQYYSFKNRLINGNLNIWQRGTSFTNTANSFQYTADRWYVFGGVGLPASSSQVATGLQNFPLALRVQRPNGNTSIANTSANQVIETVNCRDLAGQTVTASFLARAGANYSPTGNALGVWLSTGSGTDQGAQNLINGLWTSQAYAQSSVTLTTSFQQFSVTFTVPSGTNEIGLSFITFPTGTAGANDWFDVTGVQLEKGNTATSFDYRPYSTEVALCQRYFEKSFGIDTTPANGVYSMGYLGYVCFADQWVFAAPTILFKVPKRATPTISFFGTSTNTWQINDNSNNWINYAAVSTGFQASIGIYTTGFSAGVHNNGSSGYAIGSSRMIRGDWTASSEL